jgi:hypothetical protein
VGFNLRSKPNICIKWSKRPRWWEDKVNKQEYATDSTPSKKLKGYLVGRKAKDIIGCFEKVELTIYTKITSFERWTQLIKRENF